MNRYLLFALLINFSLATAQTPCSGGMAGGYPCDGLTLQSSFTYAELGAANWSSAGRTGNDSWGWTDPLDGKEYAIVGLNNGTAFIDITDPVNPRRLGRLPTQTSNSWWRDIKVYNNHAFIVSEASGHGMQIFDLTTLRGLSTNANRTFSNTAYYGAFGDAHNIIINEDSGIAYVLGANIYSGGPHFIDITTPTSPVSLGGYSTRGYTHDAQVVTYDGPDPDYQGKEIFIGSNEDEVVILDVTNKASVSTISTISYPNFHYTHQGWFTEDKKYFLLGDEEDEVMGGVGNTKTIVFNLEDLDNPSIAFNYYGPTAAIDHNGYVRGNRFYQASYRAGMRIIKLGDLDQGVSAMTEVDYFDTYPSSNSAAFNGAWNVYPYFPSGNLIISNYDGGFFVVKDPNFDDTDPVVVCQNITATLNKATGTVTINANDVDNGSTDNMGIVSMTLDGQTTFSCADVGSVFNVTLTVEDDYGNRSSCVAQVTIAAETTEYTGASWSNGTPDIGSHAKIASDYDTGVGANTSFDACSCEIDAGRTLTIQANDYINIEKDITVNGNLVVKHQGSVVQSDATASVIKNGSIDVELTTPPLKNRDFMIMGSPMTTETRTGVFNGAYNVQAYTPANFIPHSGVPAGGTNFADDNFDDWNPASGTITPGEGFLVYPQAAYNDPAYNGPPPVSTLQFNMNYTLGTLNNGTVTRSIVFNGLGSNPDGTPNMLANPYASPIDASAFVNDNALVNEVYFWEHLTAPSAAIPGANTINVSMDDISMYNGTMGVPAANDPGTSTTPNGVISTGQGFSIKAFGAGTVSFTNSMRLTSGNTTLRNPEGLEKMILKVENTQFNVRSYAGIAFRPDGSAQLDANFDSNRLATIISLYSHLEDGTEQLGIQTRETFDAEIKIPMGFSSQVESETNYVISISSLEGSVLPGVTVYLIDHRENVITELSANDYEFTSGQGTFDGRFTLQFEQDGSLGSVANKLNSVVVYPNPADNIINISSPATYLKAIEVYDVRGRRLSEEIDDKQNSVSLSVTNLETGIYFVKVDTEVGSVTKKIIKK